MNPILLTFWLFILSDGTASAVAARSAWMRKLRDTGKRPEFATAFGVGFAMYAGVQYLVVLNNFGDAEALAALPPGYLFRSILLRVCQSAAIWLISLTLMGRSPIVSLQVLFAKIRSKIRRKEQRKAMSNDDKDPLAKDLVDDLKDPNAQPKSPAPETDDEGESDDKKKDGEPIGPGE